MEEKERNDYFKRIDGLWHYRPILWATVACMLGFLIWSSLAQIHEQVRGTGRIIPAGNMQVIQHLEGGIVNQILEEEGNIVSKGDILFYIKNQKAEAELEELQIALDAAEIKSKRLGAEFHGKDKVEYDKKIEEIYSDIVKSERQIFQARQAEMVEKLEKLQKQMKQKVLKLDDLNTTIRNLTKEFNVAKEQLEIKQKLRQSGAVSHSQYLDNLSEVRNFETRIAKTQKELPITKSELAELTNTIEETIQIRRSEISEELNEVEVNIQKLKERMKGIQDEVARTSITSPVNGVVNKIYINTIGGVIQPGQRVAEIVPLDDKLIVEGQISTDDRGKIWLNLPAVAKITAYDYTLYGGLEGKLTYISSNSFVDQQNNEFYQIRLTLDMTNLSEDKPIYPGMTTEISILAEKVSVLQAILKPFRQIQKNSLRER